LHPSPPFSKVCWTHYVIIVTQVIVLNAVAYVYGTAFWLFGFSYAIMSAISAEIFVPLFYRLAITSAYEYLEMRFSRPIRLLGTTMYISLMMLRALLRQRLCATSWMDGREVPMIFSAVLTTLCSDFLSEALEIYCILSQLLDLFHHSFDPDPLRRHTFWTIVVGGSIMWLSIYSINQSQVQRYISCKTLGHAKMSLYVNMCGLLVTVTLAMLAGLTMYSIYKNCDPISNGDVGSSDQVTTAAVLSLLVIAQTPCIFCCPTSSWTCCTSTLESLVCLWLQHIQLWAGWSGPCILVGQRLQASPTDVILVYGLVDGELLKLSTRWRFDCDCISTSGCHQGWTMITHVKFEADWSMYRLDMQHFLFLVAGLFIFTCCVSFRPALADTWYSLSYLYFGPFGTLVTIICGLLVSISTGEISFPDLHITAETELVLLDFKGKPPTDISMGADNLAFTDKDVTDKDAEKCTRL
uniref:Solute carrier family 5 member 8, like n=1 Tax=Acanthochromis polyacanthus TaxID=80966 RepID=A0A3Q1FCC3_9TELE